MPRRAPDPADAAAPWVRRIRLRHLEVLLTIARHGSLTAAAAALEITQPAVSQWLADIEAAHWDLYWRLFCAWEGVLPEAEIRVMRLPAMARVMRGASSPSLSRPRLNKRLPVVVPERIPAVPLPGFVMAGAVDVRRGRDGQRRDRAR